ncbi:hypothetical protein D046_5346 [Vibrio parahaemolyticus V-223/04]|nr:hypothetical protein D046_5346 [Vibrio parahaemolyticus V-223/04]
MTVVLMFVVIVMGVFIMVMAFMIMVLMFFMLPPKRVFNMNFFNFALCLWVNRKQCVAIF